MEGNLVRGILCGDQTHTCQRGCVGEGYVGRGQHGSAQSRGRASTRRVRLGLRSAQQTPLAELRSVFFPKPEDTGKGRGAARGHQV